jgi:ATP-dependent Clp protease ATP-binding subunit ClpB
LRQFDRIAVTSLVIIGSYSIAGFTMKHSNPAAVLAVLLVAFSTMEHHSAAAFVPSKNRALSQNACSTKQQAFPPTIHSVPSAPSFVKRHGISRSVPGTALRMAAEDFSEAKYTEAAWSSIAALTKAADYYSASSVEAPLLLDVMLNPAKHNAGEDSEAARKVVEKVLVKAGADVNNLRSELEKYLSKQPRVGDNASKTMGRTLQKVLETSRQGKEVLSDSFVSTEGLLLAMVKEDAQFTREALMRQGVKYTDVLEAVKEMRKKTGPAISRSAENVSFLFGFQQLKQVQQRIPTQLLHSHTSSLLLALHRCTMRS